MGIKSNRTSESYYNFFGASGKDAATAAPIPPSAAPGVDASGGYINQWESPTGTCYRSHIFTSPGTFTVNSVSTDPTVPSDCQYFVCGGGGGGGRGCAGAGAGAGPDGREAGALGQQDG